MHINSGESNQKGQNQGWNPIFLSVFSMGSAAAKEDEVCPEGKEKLDGRLTISGKGKSFQTANIAGSAGSNRLKGRGRAIRFFKMPSLITSIKSNAAPIIRPHLRYFFVQIRITAKMIQIMPPSPSSVMYFIITSSTGFHNVSRTQANIDQSKL